MDFNQKQKNLLFGALGILSLGGIVSIVSADMGEIRMNSDFNYAPQHIEEVVFVPDGATRYDTDKLIHMNLQGGIITVSDSIVAGTSGRNSMSGVENSFILGGKENKITATNTTSGSIIGGGSGNKIENSNYAIILGGKNNTISAQSNESIILGGEGNSVEKGKGIIIGNRNRITNKQNEKETVVIGNNISVTGSDNVLMGKDYQFSGTNSFVWSTKNEAITGENEFIIKNTHGMAINLEENDTDGIALALKGALKIGEGTNDLTGNIEGAIKRMGSCLCYNDGKNWKPTKSDLICGIMCRSEKPVPGPTPNTCLSGVLLKSASNISGDYRNCIGVSGTDIITITATNCHTGFYFFSGTNTTTQISGKTYEGTGVCKEMTQYANCEGTKISSNETLYFPSSIQQTWSGTMQEFLGRAQWYYNDTLISGTCAYTCNTSKGYQYKLDTADGVCRKLIVTFDPSSKTGSTQGTITTTQKEYASGAKLGTNNPNRKGYQFSGWYVKETAYVTDSRGKPLSNDKFPAGTNVNANTLVRTDLLLGAKWNAHTYKIKYVLNGGTTGSAHPTSATFDQEFTVDHPTKTGFAFAGWDITGMDDTSHSYDNATSTATTLSNITAKRFKNLTAISGATITFSAKWSQNTYTISYNDSQCVNNAGTYPTTASFGQTFTVSNPAVKEGYIFKGWTIEGMDTTSHIVGGKTMSTTTASGITGTTFKDLTSVKNQQVHFTAICEKKKFLFDLNGYLDGVLSGFLGGYGTCDIYINGDLKYNDDHIGQVIENIPYGSTYEIKDCKAKEGYEFMGGTKDIEDNHGKMSGTFTNSDIRVAVIFNTKKPDPVNGKCATTENSCISGAVTNKNETSTTYTWTCAGLNNGTSVSCQACKDHYHQDETSCKGDQMNCPTSTPQNANLGATSYTFAGEIKTKWTQKTSGTLGACEYQCKPHFTGADCHGEALSCSGTKPENTSFKTERYTFAGQEKSWTYTGKNVNDLKECEFTCKEHYTRNATTKKCEANTQPGDCTGLPTNAKWNNNNAKFTQTWNGTTWDPTEKKAELTGNTAIECSYQCNTGYTGTDCHAQTITIKYDYKNGTHATGTATYNQNYTLLPAPTSGGYSFLERSGANGHYNGGDTLSGTIINKAIASGQVSIDFEAVWKKDYDTATLVPGSEFNVIIKKLAGANNPIYASIDTNIQSIQRASSLPSGVTTTLISIKDSIPIYAWYNQGTIYYYSESAIIFMNKDSHAMFQALSSVKDIDLSSINTSNVQDMHSMFFACDSLTGLDVSHFDTSNVTDMAYMFGGCKNLTNLDVKNFDTSTVTNMNSMFKECKKLTNLDVSHFDTSKVTEMQNMFYRCSSLTGLDVSHFDTSNVTDMHNMFYLCSSLTGLDVSHFDTSNVTDMHSMFNNCSSLTNLDVSHFNTSRVSNMYGMFEDCRSLTSLDVSHFDTSNVTDMHSMFEDCRSLTSLDVSHFNTSRVSNMYGMFSYCDSLIGLDVSHFDTSKVIDMTEMFYGCSSLTNLDLSNFNTSNVKRIDKMFGYNSNLTTIYASEKFTTNAVETDTNMFESTPKLVGGNGTQWTGSKIDKTMAKIDKPGQEGYFTDKFTVITPITVTFKTLTGGYFPNSFIMPGFDIYTNGRSCSEEDRYILCSETTLGTGMCIDHLQHYCARSSGGYPSLGNQKKISQNIGEKYILPTIPQGNDNLYFSGWYTQAIGGEEITGGTIVNVETDHILYAHYTTSKKINGICGYDYSNQSCLAGDWANGIESNTGYTWTCKGIDGGKDINCEQSKIFTLTFDTNGGNPLEKQERAYGYSWDVPQTLESRDEHSTFLGWEYDDRMADSDQEIDIDADPSLIQKNTLINLTILTNVSYNGKITLQPYYRSDLSSSWTQVAPNNTTYFGSNSSSAWKAGQVTMGTHSKRAVIFSGIVSFAKDGYYKITIKDTNNHTANTFITVGNSQPYIGNYDFTNPTVTDDLLLSALWKCDEGYRENDAETECEKDINKYTIYYNLNGGSYNGNPYMESEEWIEGQNIVVTGAKPTLKYHTFTGWIISGFNHINKAGDSISVYDIETYGEENSLTLYAQYDTGICTITFKANGGNSIGRGQGSCTDSCKYNSDYIFTGLCTTSAYDKLHKNYMTFEAGNRTGYSFSGWYTGSTNGTKITINNSIQYQNQTYYAQWKSNCWTGYVWKNQYGTTMSHDNMYRGYHLSSQYPYSGEKVSTGSYIFWTYTCPAKKQPICGTEKNTCASGSSRCDDDDGSDNKWICYSDDDIKLTVTCTGYDYYDRDQWQAASSPKSYTNGTCQYYELANQVSTCNTGNVDKKSASMIPNCSSCSSLSVSNLSQCLTRCKNSINDSSCMYAYRTCTKKYYVNPGIKGGSCPTSYTITYDANGGTGAPDKGTKKHSEPFTLSNVEPKRAGYIFKGRSTNKTSTSPTYQTGGTISASTNNNVTLYAVRQPYTYNVTLYENRGSRSTTPTVYATNITGSQTIEGILEDGRKIYVTNLLDKFQCNADYFYSFGTVKTCYIHEPFRKIADGETLKMGGYITSTDGTSQQSVEGRRNYQYYRNANTSTYPTTGREFIFDGWYTTPQTGMEIEGVDPTSFILTRDIPLLGNPSDNQQKIKDIKAKGIPINKKISKESPWDTPLASGTNIELFAHYKYNAGHLVAGYFGKNASDTANGNRKDVQDNTKETQGWWDIRCKGSSLACSKGPNTECHAYQDQDCFGNGTSVSYFKKAGNRGGDSISTSTERLSKYEAAIPCFLDDNVVTPLGVGDHQLNYMHAAYDDYKGDKKAQWHIKGCYFIIGHNNYDYHPKFNREATVGGGVVGTFAGVGTLATLASIGAVNAWNPGGRIILGGTAIGALIGWLTNRDDPVYQPFIISRGARYALRDDQKHYSYWRGSIKDLYKQMGISNHNKGLDYLQDMISDYRYKYNLR